MELIQRIKKIAVFWYYNSEKLIKASVILLIFSLFSSVLSYVFIDKSLAMMIHNTELFHALHPIMQIISSAGTYYIVGINVIPAFLIFSFSILLHKENNKLTQLFAFASCVLSIESTMLSALKFVLGRYRPMMLIDHNQYGFALCQLNDLMHSMPSGHTAISCTIAVSILIFYPRSKVFVITYAILIATSRVLLLKHFPSDVIMGASIGILFPYWSMHCVHRIRINKH